MRGLDDELCDPKYAKIELERRWLVDPAARPSLTAVPSTLIEDRYIDGTRMRLRVMLRPDSGETKWKLTKKYDAPDPAARPIVTTYLTQAEFDLLQTLPAHALVKRRYHLHLDGREWSVDLFEGALAGLEIIECEAADRADLDALVPPEWALREVTRSRHWQGGALAVGQVIPEV